MNLKKIEVKKGKVNFTFLHQFLTPEAGTVKKNRKYWLVRNVCCRHEKFVYQFFLFQSSCSKFLASISPTCCIAEEKICISRRSPWLAVRMTLLTGFALTFPVCADRVFTSGFVTLSKMDNLFCSWTLSVATVYNINRSYWWSYSEVVWGHLFPTQSH